MLPSRTCPPTTWQPSDAGILAWYAVERRDFPWRGTTDPYAVLVSEVMLQQTQASRVAERFERFLARFPDAASLAIAAPAEVLAEWSGLGYNRRALALRSAATTVARDGWPRDVDGLMRLPGVGPYTARAVASLAFGVAGRGGRHQRAALARFAGSDPRTSRAGSRPSPMRSPPPAATATSRAWTHASMELGASVCRAPRTAMRRVPRGARLPVARGGGRHPGRAPGAAARLGPSLPRRAAAGAGARSGSSARRAGGAASASPRGDGRIGPALDADGWRRIVGDLEREGLLHRSGRDIGLGAATIAK